MKNKSGNTKWFYLGGLSITIIILINILLHYNIRIIDAVSLGTLPQFEVQISSWRIIFEPILGVLLFFNRSLYTLSEFPYVLYWVLFFWFISLIFKLSRTNSRKDKLNHLIRQLLNIPIIAGLWFTIFLIIIFIPLPGNSLKNNDPGLVMVTTHSHTEYSHDGLISQKGLWKWQKRYGFDAFFITEHNNHDKTLAFVMSQRNGDFPSHPLVMCGEEFSGTNHLSLLGLKRDFITSGYSDLRAIDSTRANKGVVIVNHWFDDKNMSLDYYKNIGVDGFEIENTATDRSYDRKLYSEIKNFCLENNLTMNGGLDFHGYGNACSVWNALSIPKWNDLNPEEKEDAILEILRKGNQENLKVLLYNDRSYYTKELLFLSPFRTLFNYFRTLNFLQIISWIFWITLMTVLSTRAKIKKILVKPDGRSDILSLSGSVAAMFMLILGLIYYLRIKDTTGFTEVYKEYSTILFIVGTLLFIYSSTLAYFRFFKNS